jgi:hypothetical protein
MQLATLEAQRAHYAAVKNRLNAFPSARVVKRIVPANEPIVIPQPTPDAAPLPDPVSIVAQYECVVDTTTKGFKRKIKPSWEQFRRVLDAVAARHGLKPFEVLNPSRRQKFVIARFELCYELRKAHPNWSYSQIGRMLQRDHTSIMHGVYQWAEMNNLPIPSGE